MDDGEGPLIERVREAVGETVPIAVTLDLHGNITDQMVESAPPFNELGGDLRPLLQDAHLPGRLQLPPI
jgi:hypothetical protein